ncbi:MAG: pyridoxamine 5'-phosphate oxidase [Bacteroidetes bacterium]|nr:pyridoxamine 5'-phosphate oxidase [Bacteroidota bacterium]
MKLHRMRKQYVKGELDDAGLPDDPLVLFSQWFEEAVATHAHEANAVVLATASGNQPSARVVLLKEFGSEGFVFYTNYESRKGKELAANPLAAMLFYWPELERQVRIEGITEKVSREQSRAYFVSRPDGSRLSAIVSPQSTAIASRLELEAQADDYLKSGKPLDMPDYWGGYLLKPRRIEFWQGRANRLHDRMLYEVNDLGQWKRTRLAP